MSFYPQGDSVSAQTDVLAATTDGQHILGAAISGGGVTLSDIGISIPTNASARIRIAARLTPLSHHTPRSYLARQCSASISERRQPSTQVVPSPAVKPGVSHLHAGRRPAPRCPTTCRGRAARGNAALPHADGKRGHHGPGRRRLQPGQHALLCLHGGRQQDPLHRPAHDPDRHAADQPQPARLHARHRPGCN